MNVFFLSILRVKSLLINSDSLILQELDSNKVNDALIDMDIVIYILLGTSVILNIVLLTSKSILKNNKIGKNSDVNFKHWYEKEKGSNNKLVIEIRNLKKELELQQNNKKPSYEEKKVTPIENESQLPVPNHAIEQEDTDEKSNTVEFVIKKPDSIFLPSPFEENRFSIEDVSFEQTHSSLYQIILDSSNTNGKLLLIENADFTRALNSPDLYLEKACIYENAFSPNAKGIMVVEHGKVTLENQDWIVTEKVKIKFR